ncbi:putative RNA recognition motif domain, nucleotide-binding alpha-beta plait domain superfamily [Helianthus annuus]|uniref:RNA recognition motif domain, nucleotide-binding alpha-beta plait domain superfamily n=1 Tax=Helianthus annuus TaxID=4232 RepID=A0A9K3N4E3_HELAN|nr:putative RNA recognition motif domain, nucleotide-binding alpha-beta plait domain superfamily [Helianthus annuus]KAJ0513554.1 putative RNA recognition motif domain, nucleotide-binding alpha-beta plait domain superfamily [Helianthus annuus]KAJ0529653.1 putative RNA recognition motif domain, nucleotide-binding alpha-beta plait domain superfamily [Helianthus annuus]KAJ0879199.1 putative RNA recognition motif domain, nucleotide-binding alpha-beta plait domain superfamily [Helianthus annuus]KAJ08
MAESRLQVDSDLAPPTNPINNGKRGAEEVVEPQVVGNKKHKKTEGQNEVERPPATTQDDAKRVSISNEYKEKDKDDCSTQDRQIPNRRNALKQKSELLLDHPTRLDLATEHNPTRDTGSKTLFLGNLSFLIEEDDVDFFKNVGEIADIRFAIKDDRFLGYGHIEFATAEAAQEALKLNKEVLLGRRVALEYTRRQRGAYTPAWTSLTKGVVVMLKQKRYMFEDLNLGTVLTIFRVDLKSILTSVERFHVCTYRKITCLGLLQGLVAFIEFTDRNGFCQALGLDGSEVGGSRLTVEEAKKQRGDGWSGIYVRESGCGGGRSASAGNYDRETGSRGGSAGSHVRESGSGGGRNGSHGGWSGSAGSYASDSGSVGGWSGSGGGWSGCAGSYGRESVSGGSYGRESGSGGNYGRERGSRGGWWRRESGYGSRLCMESGYGSVSHTESGSGGGWRRESGYGRGGRGWESGNGYGGWGRGSSSRSNDCGFSSSGGGRVSSHRVGSRRGGLP